MGSGTHIGSGVMNRAASHTHESLCCGETRHKLQQGSGGYRDIIVSVTRDSLSITRRLAKCLQQQNMWRADTVQCNECMQTAGRVVCSHN